ncbi:hypothetical protein VFMJ11_1670 [Aliivibrio fischeri MJ11]|uniref:Uncharacterized protein n=1 Tax=Aliivibrio fischeri (strain MJ11) TaxID=388396 RepID=B5FEZ6_ALIFM|nr:hypothetical protein VFMJ11_1670 [Aliivibrio fischeri MJ11]
MMYLKKVNSRSVSETNKYPIKKHPKPMLRVLYYNVNK